MALCYNLLVNFYILTFPPCSIPGIGHSPKGGGEWFAQVRSNLYSPSGPGRRKNTEIIEKFKALIESHGGEVLKLDKWGKRRLAYEVKDYREGLYILVQMKAESKVATELDRVFKITDEVLRHMIIREDE